MIPMTTSKAFPKTAPACTRSRDPWDDIDIGGHCFWLGLMHTGEAIFELDGRRVVASAPCFLCFDDSHTPRVIRKKGVMCDSIYFDPTFININMTSERVHSEHYPKIAAEFDLFLLTPFTDPDRAVFPLQSECLGKVKQMFSGMEREFTRQTDWFWTCRSRSYFTELIFLLEYAYHYTLRMEEGMAETASGNAYLQRALAYIGSHFAEEITLADIVQASGLNHTSLTRLFNQELMMSPVEYLWHHRIRIAERQLEFTALPIKDISARCGFKTVQHFGRKFAAATGETPAVFRKNKLRARQNGLGQDGSCAVQKL